MAGDGMIIEYGDRPRGHDNLGYGRAEAWEDWHLVSFQTWNNMSFCGKPLVAQVEKFVSGSLCDTCAHLLGIGHSEFGAA
jgi:hypothetical protein